MIRGQYKGYPMDGAGSKAPILVASTVSGKSWLRGDPRCTSSHGPTQSLDLGLRVIRTIYTGPDTNCVAMATVNAVAQRLRCVPTYS